MPRVISAGTLRRLDNPDPAQVRLFNMAFLDLETQPLRLHNDVGAFEWNGGTWTGLGDMGNVTEVVEDGQLAPGRFNLSLNGLKSEWIVDTRSERHIGRRCDVYLAAMEIATGQPSGDPLLIVRGVMQAVSMNVWDESAALSLRVEDQRALLQRDPGIWFSNEGQQTRRPGDTFFSLMEDTPRVRLQWGERGANPYSGAGAPGAGGNRGGNWRRFSGINWR